MSNCGHETRHLCLMALTLMLATGRPHRVSWEAPTTSQLGHLLPLSCGPDTRLQNNPTLPVRALLPEGRPLSNTPQTFRKVLLGPPTTPASDRPSALPQLWSEPAGTEGNEVRMPCRPSSCPRDKDCRLTCKGLGKEHGQMDGQTGLGLQGA